MASKTDICNMALSHLKSGIEITNVVTEQSQAAKACRRYYDTIRDEFQSSFAWNFNKKTAALTWVADNPTTVWSFSYTYPTDCLFARRIASVTVDAQDSFAAPVNAIAVIGNTTTPVQDTQNSAIPFEVAGTLIYTNMPSAILEYSYRNDDETTWPAKVSIAMSYALASYIAPRMTDGDPFNMVEKMMALAEKKLNEAKAASGNERLRIQPDSEFTRMR